MQLRVGMVNALVLSALLLSSAPVFAAPRVQAAPTLQDCSAVAEDTLQSELNIVTQQVFAIALAKLDLETIVGKAWVTLEMDAALDDAVDRAVERVKGETDLWNKFLSGWAPDKAKELTLAVATYTFDDPTFRTKMDELAAAVSQTVAERLTLASADSVSSALYCLQTFIGRNYSKALVAAFEDRVQAATTDAMLVDAAALSPDVLAMVGEHELALGGVGVIIAAQITKKIVTSLAQRISQRVAGRIVGRVLGRAGSTIIPIAGWLIGTGMIVYDLYDSRDGALPQIQESIKGDAVAAGVREEIAVAIRPELEAELPGLARTIANDLYAEWRNTKRNIRQVIDLAAAEPKFAAILGAMETPEQVAQLVALVTLLRKSAGEDGLARAVADGTLRKAAGLPAGAVAIAQETGSLGDALAWYDAVGGRIDEVVALEIYRHTTPASIDLDQLDKLLALEDKTAVARLTLLPPVAQGELLAIATENLVKLANQLTPDELEWLASVLPTVKPAQRNELVARILSQPEVTPALRQLGDLGQLAARGNLDAAITFVTGPKEVTNFWLDVGSVLTGAAAPPIFAAKHGAWPAVGAGATVLLVILIALRLLWGLGAWFVSPLSIFRRR